MNNQNQKLYDIFEHFYTEKFYEENFVVWEEFLHNLGVETHNWDKCTPHLMYADMLNIISDNNNCVAINDPACEHSGYQEVFACLLVPNELAEKILVLGCLPCTNNSESILS
jgi:hypothetical protein